MRYLLLLAIQAYWLIPTRLHDRCIFRESCSHYVYRVARQRGFLAGLSALMERNSLCRPGYVVYRFEGKFFLKTAGGQVFEEDDIALSLLPPLNMDYLDFDDGVLSGGVLNLKTNL